MEKQPDKKDNQEPGPPGGTGILQLRPCPRLIFVQHFRWHKPDCKHNPCRDDDEVIEIPEDRDEIRDEIDRVQCIGNRQEKTSFCIPGNTRSPRAGYNAFTSRLRFLSLSLSDSREITRYLDMGMGIVGK
ncbi:MAG: hypothetical protein LUQ19_04230 [Methanoregula sp.]|nr:hypothetical protein [Methanoregula sp.]